MSAHPIIPGRAYRVRWQGRTLIVLADHPVSALIAMMEVRP